VLIPIVSRRVDSRDRRDRMELQNSQWDMQMDRLVIAYLDYIAAAGEDMMVPHDNLARTENDQTTGNPSDPQSKVDVVDMFCEFDLSNIFSCLHFLNSQEGLFISCIC
jgi:hypothetical protein